MQNNIIKIEAKHAYTMFPKKPTVLGRGEDTYGIVCWTVTDVIEGEPKTDLYDAITVTGTYEEQIESNKTYTILAKEIEHEKYGIQYELMFIGEILDFTSVGNQKAFLKTFLTDGQIEEMFKVLKNPLEIIQNHDTQALKKVHGIGDYISERIIERFEECKDYCNVYLELDGLGLTPKFIQKLIAKYINPNKVIEIVKKNPYQLSFDIEGIGFKTADKIALNNGTDPKSKERIKSFINYLLEELAEAGDSFIYAYELTDYIFDELGGKEEILEIYYDEDGRISGNNIGVAIEELKQKEILVVEENENISKSERRVYLKKYYDLECEISYHLKRLTEADNTFDFGKWREVVKLQEEEQGWEFTEEQIKGIEACLTNQVIFITGGAGVGKTSVLGGALQALKCYEGKYSFAQTSLSGKAAARMQEVTGQDGYTIHRLLGFQPPYSFTYNEDIQLPYDIIILDEISLVGGEIFLSLIKAIPTGSKLIMLGDMGQLESIGCLNLAQDIYNSDYITTVELTKIHRQAQKSGIIVASQAIRHSESIFERSFQGKLTMGELQDMHFDVNSSKDTIREKVLDYFIEYWNGDLVYDIMDIQILAPVKERGEASVMNLNLDVQDFINPSNKLKKEYKIEYDKGSYFYLREGDKVMNIKNNYKLCNIDGNKTAIFNGWVGTLTKISPELNSAIIYFPIINDSIVFTLADLKKHIILGYASTVHKFQGSSAKVVIGVLDYSTPPNMRTKELAYTLPTRAEKECVFVVQNKAFDDAIQTSGVSNKNTFLLELLNN
jgi:exodeoxyribonuclease V alpha subunit